MNFGSLLAAVSQPENVLKPIIMQIYAIFELKLRAASAPIEGPGIVIAILGSNPSDFAKNLLFVLRFRVNPYLLTIQEPVINTSNIMSSKSRR